MVTDPWLENFLEHEHFVLSGILAKDAIFFCRNGISIYEKKTEIRSIIDDP